MLFALVGKGGYLRQVNRYRKLQLLSPGLIFVRGFMRVYKRKGLHSSGLLPRIEKEL